MEDSGTNKYTELTLLDAVTFAADTTVTVTCGGFQLGIDNTFIMATQVTNKVEYDVP